MNSLLYESYSGVLGIVNRFRGGSNDTASERSPESFFQQVYLSHINRCVGEHFGARRDLKILDAGCGRFAVPLSEAGYQVRAIDCSKQAIEGARKNAMGANVSVDLIHGDIARESRTMKDGLFDIVLCLEVLPYLVPYRTIFAGLERVLTRGGLLFVTFQPAYYFITTLLKQRKFNAARYVTQHSEGLLRIATAPAYYNWPDTDEILRLHEASGLTSLGMIPIGKYCGFDRDGVAGILNLEDEGVADAYPRLLEIELVEKGSSVDQCRHSLFVSTK